METTTTTRAPKYLGTGIHVHQQFDKEDLVKGDTFFDSDYGDMMWNGKRWINHQTLIEDSCLQFNKSFDDEVRKLLLSDWLLYNKANNPAVGRIYSFYKG